MRRILIESARKKMSQKRGSNVRHTELNESKLEFTVPSEEILAIEEALKKLEVESPEYAEVVKLRYFAGMTVPETAHALGSPRARCIASGGGRGPGFTGRSRWNSDRRGKKTSSFLTGFRVFLRLW